MSCFGASMLLLERFHLCSILHPDGSRYDYLTAAFFGLCYFLIRFCLDRLLYGVGPPVPRPGVLAKLTLLDKAADCLGDPLQPVGRYILYPDPKKSDDKPSEALQKKLTKFQGAMRIIYVALSILHRVLMISAFVNLSLQSLSGRAPSTPFLPSQPPSAAIMNGEHEHMLRRLCRCRRHPDAVC